MKKIMKLIIVALLFVCMFGTRIDSCAADKDWYIEAVTKLSNLNINGDVQIGKEITLDIPDSINEINANQWPTFRFQPQQDVKLTASAIGEYFDEIYIYLESGTYVHRIYSSSDNKNYDGAKKTELSFEFKKGSTYYLIIGNTKSDPAHKTKFKLDKPKRLKDVKNISVSTFTGKYVLATYEFVYEDSTSEMIYCSIGNPKTIKYGWTYDIYGNNCSFSFSNVSTDTYYSLSGQYDVELKFFDFDNNEVATKQMKLHCVSYDDIKNKSKEINLPGEILATTKGCYYKFTSKGTKYITLEPKSDQFDNLRNNEVEVLIFEANDKEPGGLKLVDYKEIITNDLQYLCMLSNKEYYIFVESRNKEVKMDFGYIGAVVPVNSVTLPANVSLNIGDMEFLADSIVIAPANATNKSVIWKSSNPAVATVSANGKVTAISVGTTKITAYVDGKYASTVVTVNRLAQTIAKFKINNGKKYVDKVTVKVRNLKKAKKTFALYTVSTDEKSQKTYKILSATKKKSNGKFAKFSKKKFKISKGKLVIPKNLGKGTYKIKIKVTARITSKYNAVMKEKTFTMIVK